ncbi:MAG: mechanosensitive ion channel domain-containing protein [Bacteroidota bacterium]
MNISDILDNQILESFGLDLTVGTLLSALLVLVFAKLLILFVQRVFLKRLFKKRKVDIGRQYTIVTLLRYVVFTIGVLAALQVLGVQFSVLLGGAAALLVGIGLGLQQTFNDLISGIILLSEGTVEVGDIISVDGMIGTVVSIGIRTSEVETRDEISIIIPNSKLVVDNVVNLSHNDVPPRFQINVGVAYTSDVEQVTSLLLETARNHKRVLKKPAPHVLFKDFGNSSLDFELHFYSDELLKIEFVKSDIRFRIIELFREHQIEIPFPQTDLWVRSPVEISKKETGS